MAWKRARGTTAQAQTTAPTESDTATRTIAQREPDEVSRALVPEDPQTPLTLPDHEELHRKLHALHHARAVAEQGPPSGSSHLKRGKEKVIKTKKRSKNSHNQSKNSDEFEFTRTTVAKSSSTRTEQRTIDWSDGISRLSLEEAPMINRSNFNLGIRENEDLVELERSFEEEQQWLEFEDDQDQDQDDETTGGSGGSGSSYARVIGQMLSNAEVQCVLLAIVAAFILPLVCTQQLQIQACCGSANQSSQCQNFSRAQDLLGVACCGLQPYNAFTKICCNGAVRDRQTADGRYAELCCGTSTLAYDQTCCDGVVHNVPGGDCCGAVVYSKSDPTLKCCNETLVRATSANDICCGGTTFDGGRTQMCCGDSVFQISDFDSCCESPSGTFAQFNSATQFCCGTPQQRNGNMACCYLRVNGQLLQAAYDKRSQCCKFPFDIIQPMVNSSCV